MPEMTVSEAREKFSDLIGMVHHGREDVTILRHGKPVAVVISAEAYAYYEALEDADLAKEAAVAYAEYLADPSSATPFEEYLTEAAVRDAAE
ncbi:MAG: type II toxin-antitoxin system Phd/YefM family antitoxin [Gemmobacter sp.]